MDVRHYLERIGSRGIDRPDLENLRHLHRAHLLAVPFENLHIRARIPIELDVERLFDKVVRQRRGGFCYELNGLFAEMLERLGYTLARVQGQVYEQRRQRFGPPFDHMALLVTVGEDRYLADVGFGDLFMDPLPLRVDEPLVDNGRTFRFHHDGSGQLVLKRTNGRGDVPVYRFSTDDHPFADFAPMCRHHQTSPHSHFTQRTVVSLARDDGRVTLTERRTILTRNGSREERSHDETGFREALWTHFGMTVPEAFL